MNEEEFRTGIKEPEYIYIWLIMVENELRIRKWDTKPFPEANISGPRNSD